MEKLLKEFDAEVKNSMNLGRRYYQVNSKLKTILDQMRRKPHTIGTYLGEKKKFFTPSTALLEIIAKQTDKKTVVTEKAEWMFLCGRDVFAENCTGVMKGKVLVMNKHDENIGLGKWERNRGKSMLKNIIDRGSFLRRERN